LVFDVNVCLCAEEKRGRGEILAASGLGKWV
jgi:hypothetical protein